MIARCVYGVDVNPMAAELCRFNLLLEGLDPEKPLSFLDHHVQVGNALLGTTPELITGGIPDDAFKPLEGDERKLTNAYKKRNREERKAWDSGQLVFSLGTLDRNREAIERGYGEVESGEEDSVAAVRKKASRYSALQDSEEMLHARRLADAWCAAFVWPKREGMPEAVTHGSFAEFAEDAHALPRETEAEIEQVANRYNFFHWYLAFPSVFNGKGGFDVVLGNPPWERIKLQEKEWFAARRPEITAAPSAAARNRMISALKAEDSALYTAFLDDLRKADGTSHLIRSSGRFPLCGRGDVNTYSVFAETNRSIVASTGRVGCIVPSGIATDNTTKEFFGDLVDTKTLASLYDFENRNKLFPTVDGRMKFSLLTITGQDRPAEVADFSFFALDVADLKDHQRRFPLSAEDIRLLNPNTRTCPIFRTRRDAEITKSIYHRVPVLINEWRKDGNPWNITFLRMFDMSNDSGLFRAREGLESDGWKLEGNVFCRNGEQYLPLYEAKMASIYNHRSAHVVTSKTAKVRQGQPQTITLAERSDPLCLPMPHAWVAESDVAERIKNKWSREWLLAWRRVSIVTNERTLLLSTLPKSAVGDSLFLLFPHEDIISCTALIANLSSFPSDYICRQKMGGVNLSYFIMEQLPVLPPDAYNEAASWDRRVTLRGWVSTRVLELTYTAWDLEPFARDLGYNGPPFKWNPERRFLLRCELDAAFFYLYGIARDDVDYIMETFPIVKRRDEAAYGEYRTKRVILELYDQMAEAAETGGAYQTPLDPLPVDLGTSEDGSNTATRPLARGEHPAVVKALNNRQESPNDADRKLEKKWDERGVRLSRSGIDRTQAEELAEKILRNADFSQLPPEHRGDATDSTEPVGDASSGAASQPTLAGYSEDSLPDNLVDAAPTLRDAALALHACVPDVEKVARERLLLDAARELGYTKLTRKVRRVLNKALNAENNAGRLRTDWERVWRPRQR